VKEPPSPTVGAAAVTVVGADEQTAVDVDVERWSRLAHDVLVAEGAVGELTLTFLDEAEIADLNAEHLARTGPTDVLSFPLDGFVAAAEPSSTSERPASAGSRPGDAGVPVLLGDVVVCPAVAAAQAPGHAGTVDDELALLVVHGILHILGHDHAEPGETVRMLARERELLETFHWHGPAPAGFRQDHE
jgi:probable rRNA maturation factor